MEFAPIAPHPVPKYTFRMIPLQHDPNAAEFWRAKADLSILKPGNRARFYLALITGVFTSVGFVGLLTEAFKAQTREEIVPLIGSALAVAAFPLYLCIEMFFKGGDAGAKLIAECSALQNRLNDKRTSMVVSAAFQELRHALKPVKERIPQRPGSGRADELPNIQAQFDTKLREDAMKLVCAANDKLTRIAPETSIPTDLLSSATNTRDVSEAIVYLEEQMQAIERHL